MDTMAMGIGSLEYLKQAARYSSSGVRSRNLRDAYDRVAADEKLIAQGRSIADFEETDDLYRYDLNGNPVPPVDERVSPLCPLCNNSRWEDIDRDLMSGTAPKELQRRYGMPFSEADIVYHVVNHLMPISLEVIDRMGSAPGADIDPDATKGLAISGKITRLRTGQYLSDWAPDQPTTKATEKEILALSRAGVYAVQEGKTLPTRIWSPLRMAKEVELRSENTINFFDEMLAVRKMSYRVYDEVMEAGEIKNYGIAISAVKEIRGVVETLGKFSLIAKQLGEDGGKMKRLSPHMQDMIAKLGIGDMRSITPEEAGNEETLTRIVEDEE